MNAYRFIISLFGEKHSGMLLTNLYSISLNAPEAHVSVFWQDIGQEQKENFKKAFPNVDFRETHFDIASTKIKRISSKMLFWNYAAKQFTNENLCFIDVDMLVVKDIGQFFDQNFDIAFTYKDDLFPLNTGVMLCKGSQRAFFEKWLEKTLVILNDKKLLTLATSTKYPYGGGDQMSLFTMLNYKRGIDRYEVLVGSKDIRVIGIPCAALNETRSVPLSPDSHILHYKGGWQLILLEGKGFTKSRPKQRSWEMYILYLETYKAALAHLGKVVGVVFDMESFGIRIPFYINKKNLKENKFLYVFFALLSSVSEFGERIYLFGKRVLGKRQK